MIIIKLAGGLGNQMFEYAFGRMLARRNNAELKFDISEFKNDPQREYSLAVFNTIEKFATPDEIARFKKYDRRKGRFWFWHNRLIADESNYVREKQYNFDQNILKVKPPVYLDGYWQTEKYFEEIKDVIRTEFTLKNPLSDYAKRMEAEIFHTNAVSIHIRRGDYISDAHTNNWLGTCSLEYYREAINLIAQRVKNPNFFIFSDDPAWAKENIIPAFPAVYSNNTSDRPEEDMYLMSRCRHHIIANSSFSWWGAWLNPNPQKIVIGPSHWFNSKKFDTRDLMPESWIKI